MSENHEESSRKEKRDYLQAEIIGNDYDPEEFAEYLNRKKCIERNIVIFS